MTSSKAKDTSNVQVQVVMFPHDGNSTMAKTYTYNLHVGPGDEGEPVITLMQLDED